MSKFAVVIVAVVCAVSLTAFGRNKVVFDNQSGDPALVKLIGPTTTEVEVLNGGKAGVDAGAGKYTIKVRYGTPANYRYSKGQEFEVTETGSTRSETTITLHTVVAGNYDALPISAMEFGNTPPAKGLKTGVDDKSRRPTPGVPSPARDQDVTISLSQWTGPSQFSAGKLITLADQPMRMEIPYDVFKTTAEIISHAKQKETVTLVMSDSTLKALKALTPQLKDFEPFADFWDARSVLTDGKLELLPGEAKSITVWLGIHQSAYQSLNEAMQKEFEALCRNATVTAINPSNGSKTETKARPEVRTEAPTAPSREQIGFEALAGQWEDKEHKVHLTIGGHPPISDQQVQVESSLPRVRASGDTGQTPAIHSSESTGVNRVPSGFAVIFAGRSWTLEPLDSGRSLFIQSADSPDLGRIELMKKP